MVSLFFFSSVQKEKTKDDLEGAFHGISLWIIRVCVVLCELLFLMKIINLLIN